VDTSIFCKIVVALTSIPQYWGLLLDVIDKMVSPNFAKELAKFARKETCWVKATTIKIVRGFNPTEDICKGWSIEKDGTDTRSIALTELDITQVQFVTMLNAGETSIKGEEKLKRMKASGNIRLDADIFLTLFKDKALIPESWKKKVGDKTLRIYFDGTILRFPNGDRGVLCLFWMYNDWYCDVNWLGSNRDANTPSAVLES